MAIYIPGTWKRKKKDPNGNLIPGFPPSPHVTAQVESESNDIFQPTDFLIDTGADTTCLSPDDRDKLGITLDMVEGERTMGGIGGHVLQRYLHDINLYFSAKAEGEKEWKYSMEKLGVIWPAENKRDDYKGVPSLLGRDFLQNCTIRMDPEGDEIYLKVEEE